MRQLTAKTRPAQVPFIRRKATIVFEANVRPKGNSKASISPADFCLSADDRNVYTQLAERFFREGVPVVSTSADEIASVMSPAVFMEALPRLVKAGSISVSFWEHRASTPNLWRRVPHL